MTEQRKLEPSLYDKLGGEGTIKALVENFYGRLLADGALAPVFADTDMGRLKRHQALFISQALGGPKQYDGRDMAAAHAHLKITDGQFDAVAGHLDAAMAELGVSSADRAVILETVGGLRGQVVTATGPAPAAEQTLYDKLGGEGTVKALVEDFYGRVLADGSLASMFAGTDLPRLKRHQALFISQALGGPKQYGGRDMAAAHAHLKITDGQFDTVAGHLDSAMAELGVSNEDRAVVLETVGSLRGQVVNATEPAPAVTPAPAAPAAPPPPAPVTTIAPAGPSLYERLGGEATIKAVVDEFYRRVLADRLLAPVFAKVDMGRLKRHQALFLSQALGGPKQYDGRDMYPAHAHLGITGAQFDAVAGHLVATLQHFRVAQADIDTVVGAVAPLRTQIVMDPFMRWLRSA